MKRWFRSQPIHRKLVLTSMVKTTAVLFAAMMVLLVLDSIRFNTGARADVASIAEMVAENVRAAVAFADHVDTSATLSTLKHRTAVQRGCVYDYAGAMVAEYKRVEFACSASLPPPEERPILSAVAPVVNQGAVVGHVFIDRDWAALRQRLVTAGLASLVILILAGWVMLVVSSRLHRNISQPITELASAASRMGQDTAFQMPEIKAVDAIRPAADHAGRSLIVSLPDDACVIKGDRDRLRQIVWNLLSNAVKFAPRGVVRVTVSQESNQLRLTVSDTGVGIAPEFQAHVFDRFRQADSSITREHGGLGIGLAVVKELVELHGGAISVNSRGRGTGATFSVLFPCIDATVPHAVPREKVPSLAGLSVLAVDDNADSLDVLTTILAEAGANFSVAASGAEALQFWREGPSDVVLCDLAMPGMSGFQLLAHIRELDRQAGRVTPAIAVTAHASEEQIAKSAQAGFQNHVAKPFDRSLRSTSAEEEGSPRRQVQASASINLPGRTTVDWFFRSASALPALAIPAYATSNVTVQVALTREFSLLVAGRNLHEATHVAFTGSR